MQSNPKLRSPAAVPLAVAGAFALATAAWAAEPSASSSAPQVHQAEVAGAADVTAQVKAGETVYQTVCLACHQADGKGLPGAFPPLAGSDYLLGDKERAVGVVLRGLEGEVVVNGVKYNSVMPAMTQLSDKEIADVADLRPQYLGKPGRLGDARHRSPRSARRSPPSRRRPIRRPSIRRRRPSSSTRAHPRRWAPRARRSASRRAPPT